MVVLDDFEVLKSLLRVGMYIDREKYRELVASVSARVGVRFHKNGEEQEFDKLAGEYIRRRYHAGGRRCDELVDVLRVTKGMTVLELKRCLGVATG